VPPHDSTKENGGMSTVEQMRLFLEPESITAVGISRQTGPQAFNLFETCCSTDTAGDSIL
jgi:hypothetical protein